MGELCMPDSQPCTGFQVQASWGGGKFTFEPPMRFKPLRRRPSGGHSCVCCWIHQIALCLLSFPTNVTSVKLPRFSGLSTQVRLSGAGCSPMAVTLLCPFIPVSCQPGFGIFLTALLISFLPSPPSQPFFLLLSTPPSQTPLTTPSRITFRKSHASS